MQQRSLTHEPAFEYAKGADTRLLRTAFGRFATGVTIVTATDGAAPVGVTANSFTSVSLDPPLILVCLGKSLGCVDTFARSERFAINVLSAEQRADSARFATKGIDRFKDTRWRYSEADLPLIDDALAHIECQMHNQLDCGDHVIFVGEVLIARYQPDLSPLLYFGGEYGYLK
ncbi:MAG: flavin reductase family protein [Pseudomonadota bacterium]